MKSFLFIAVGLFAIACTCVDGQTGQNVDLSALLRAARRPASATAQRRSPAQALASMFQEALAPPEGANDANKAQVENDTKALIKTLLSQDPQAINAKISELANRVANQKRAWLAPLANATGILASVLQNVPGAQFQAAPVSDLEAKVIDKLANLTQAGSNGNLNGELQNAIAAAAAGTVQSALNNTATAIQNAVNNTANALSSLAASLTAKPAISIPPITIPNISIPPITLPPIKVPTISWPKLG